MQIIREKEKVLQKVEKTREEAENSLEIGENSENEYTITSELDTPEKLLFKTKQDAKSAILNLISDMKSVAIVDEITRRKERDPQHTEKCQICQISYSEAQHFEKCFLEWVELNFDIKLEVSDFLERSCLPRFDLIKNPSRPKIGSAATRMIAAALEPSIGKILRKNAKKPANPKNFGSEIKNTSYEDFKDFLKRLRNENAMKSREIAKDRISDRIKSVPLKEINSLDFLSAYDYVTCLTFEHKV